MIKPATRLPTPLRGPWSTAASGARFHPHAHRALRWGNLVAVANAVVTDAAWLWALGWG